MSIKITKNKSQNIGGCNACNKHYSHYSEKGLKHYVVYEITLSANETKSCSYRLCAGCLIELREEIVDQ